METKYITITLKKGGMNQKECRSISQNGTRKILKIVGLMILSIMVLHFGTIEISQDPHESDGFIAEYCTQNENGSNCAETIGFVMAEKEPEIDLAEPVLPDSEDSVIVLESLDVPTDADANKGTKTYMSYKAISAPASVQYSMQKDAWTDENGFRRYGDCYMVALGTFYAKSCGETFLITLDTGVSFKAVTGDIKDDKHTDSKHQHRDGNIVEFIVDSKAIPKMCRLMGDMSYAADFAGRIASIERIADTADAPV